jgi:outer membrane protein OmpA-like peptidoglycan-associated protein
MKTRKWTLLCLIGVVFLCASAVLAEFQWTDIEVEGSQDHPMFSRFPGAVIAAYSVRSFDEYVLPLGSGVGDDGESLTESLDLEGRITRIQYGGISSDRSTLEIFRNYQTAMKTAGFEILFEAKAKDLHDQWPKILYRYVNTFRPDPNFLPSGTPPSARYLSGRLARPEGDVYVSLLVVAVGAYDLSDQPVVQLDVIEIEPMETGLITVNAGAIADNIAKTGHIALYGLLFDTGTAELKPESAAVLDEIAAALREDTDLKLYIVGHTDNVGGFESNMSLSRDRAAAVITALVSDAGIDVGRVSAHGVGPLVPVASNATEEGRRLNRRVELVVQ